MICPAPSCCGPSFGCGGFTGGFIGSPMFISSPIFINPALLGRYQQLPNPEDRFGAKLRIKASLDGSKLILPSNMFEGWLAKHVVEMEHQVEPLAPSEFINKAGAFFTRTGMGKVVGVWADSEQVFSPEGDRRGQSGMSVSMLETSKKVENREHVDQVKVEAGGKNADFEMHQILLYRQVHDVGGPAIYFDVLGLPIEWSQREGEEELDYVRRVNYVLDNKDLVSKKDAEATAKMERLAQDYESLLNSVYYAKNLSHELKVDFAKIVV